MTETHAAILSLLSLLLSFSAAACHRTPPAPFTPAPDAAAPLPVASSPIPPPEHTAASPDPTAAPPPLSDDETPLTPAITAEARRVSLRTLASDRQLLPHEPLIRAHFGGVIPFPLAAQVADVGGGRRAILLYPNPKKQTPLILVLDADGKLLWTKERPLAGIVPGNTEMVIAPGPRGNVVLSWFDEPTHLVAARVWTADGSILADFQLLDIGACEALSGMYWPRHGFVVIASQAGAARAQMLDDGGHLMWTREGARLPWASEAAARVSVALDTSDSMVAFQVGRAGDPGAPAHLLAARYDGGWTALWPRVVDLGLPTVAKGRISAERVEEGLVRATLGGAPVHVTSSGIVATTRR